MNTLDIADDMRRLSGLLDEALTGLIEWTHKEAEAERDYRKALAKAWVRLEGPQKQREVLAHAECADDKYAALLAAGMSRAALEAVRSKRSQISALQSLSNAYKSEADFARTGP